MLTLLTLFLAYDVCRGRGYISGATLLAGIIVSFFMTTITIPIITGVLIVLGNFKLVGGEIYWTVKSFPVITTPKYLSFEEVWGMLENKEKAANRMIQSAEKE